ncbi:hypothetical protein Pmi06nite_21530 [Planotetraspora mira]|uniref:Uncharacterized protein n=1 Tax=Planotetraspora mira TaxID=58121 RepID=A0A8J3TMV3_9ACTN|nr:hypothetical protein Pmi06nite_21530 [Planotetraspora mira]
MAAASTAVRRKPVNLDTIVPAAMIALARSILLIVFLQLGGPFGRVRAPGGS